MSYISGGGGGGGGSGGRTVLTGNTTYFVRSTGNDGNNGTSSGTAWLTLDHANQFINETIDKAGFLVIVDIGAGSFAGTGLRPGVGGGLLFWRGAGSASTTITSGPNDGFYNAQEAFNNYYPLDYAVWLNGFTINGANGAIAGWATAAWGIGDPTGAHPQDVNFVGNLTPQATVFATGMGVSISDTFVGGGSTITGNQNIFMLAENSSQITVGNTYTISGAPTLTFGLLQCNEESMMIFNGPTSGSWTGRSFIVTQNSVILGGSSDAATFPGASQLGLRRTGGTYVNNATGETWNDKWISPDTGATVWALDSVNGTATLTSVANPTVPSLNVVGGTNITGASSVPIAQFTQTWNNSGTVFTGVKVNITNTASNTGSKILDLQVGGTSFFTVDKGGNPNVVNGAAYLYNGSNLGFIVPNGSGDNVFLGEAGNFTVSGDRNFGEGPQALSSLTTGTRNMAMGAQAMQHTTTGQVNCALGQGALQTNTTGSNNMAVGQGALLANIDGHDNVAIGSNALGAAQHDSGDVALGSGALQAKNGGSQNTAVGQGAAQSLVTGSNNVILGTQAGSAYTAGESGNTIIGLLAGTAGENFTVRIGAGGNLRARCDSTNSDWHFSNGIFIAETTDILHATNAMTNNAGVSTGTLTNAPAAGNPTKWLAFDDAGTTRFIPAW